VKNAKKMKKKERGREEEEQFSIFPFLCSFKHYFSISCIIFQSSSTLLARR